MPTTQRNYQLTTAIYPHKRGIMQLICLFLLYCWLPYHLSAQELEFEHITLQDGLSQSSVYAICQDQRGFMWFGTQDGLNKYDGYKFTAYHKTPGERSNSLSDNWVKAIIEDQKGFLWIGTDKGLNRFHHKTQTFREFLNNPKDTKSLINNKVNVLLEDRKGSIWVGTSFGLDYYDAQQDNFRHISHPKLFGVNINALIKDVKGNLWIGTSQGLFYYNRQEDKVEDFPELGLLSTEINALFLNAQQKLWVGGKGGLDYLDLSRRRPKILKQLEKELSLAHITAIHQDKIQQVLWLGTKGGGINRLNLKNWENQIYYHDPQNGFSLNANEIFTFYSDNKGTLWIGTYTGGVDKLDQRRKDFEHFFYEAQNPNSLSSNNVKSFAQDEEGNLWIATYAGGLNRYNPRQKQFTHFKHDPEDPNSLSNNDVQCVYYDRKGRLWIGTRGGGLDLYNPKTNSFIRHQNDPNDSTSISSNKIRVIYEDRKGQLWIGTYGGGLERFDTNRGVFSHYFPDEGKKGSISSNIIYSIYEDRKGRLWVGTRDAGLNLYDEKRNRFIYFQHNDKDPKSLSHNNIMSIYEDSKGRLWVGTYGGALNLLNKDGKTFTRFNEKDGLPNDVAYGILEDERGHLWISTNKGIARFNPDTRQIRNYDVMDGLQSNEFNGGAYYKSPDGKMYFGGINGFNAFFPADIQNNPYKPSVVITDFLVFNQSVGIGSSDSLLKYHISETKSITLSYYESVFSFEFAALNYTQNDKNQYAYRLRNFKVKNDVNDKEGWIYTSADRRFATYTNLDPGTYYFEVKASNNDGVWNETPTVLKIKILPPFWLTWWFRILVVLSIAGIGFAWYRWRINSIIKQKQKLALEVDRQTAEVQKQKQEVEKLLHNILPEEIAYELQKQGEVVPVHYERVTVLFTDFKGFTNLAESLPPEEVIRELNHCFLKFDEIIEKYNLEKIKTIGDAYMCAGGIPVVNQTNPVDTVKAALEMQAFMQRWKKAKEAHGEQAWELRVGIHTGALVAGVIGKKKFAYDIWGDTVNTAARMESSSEVGKVNISGTTYELIKDYFDCNYRGKIKAKNKGEIDMYFVEGIKESPDA